MCIVVDPGTLPIILKDDNSDHENFKPVLDWILSGQGKLVYGGTTYAVHLERMPSILKVMRLMREGRRVLLLDNSAVDQVESQLYSQCKSSKFDDGHVVAAVIVSGCRLVCTHDTSSHRFLRRDSFYVGKARKPSIYSNTKCCRLLCKKNAKLRY